MKKYILSCAFVLISAFSYSAPIAYEGELFDGVTQMGDISTPFDTGSDWWFFQALLGDIVTISVNRLNANLDPSMYLYQGLQSNTSSLPSAIANADDNLLELPGFEGPFADPQILNFTLPGAGYYTIAVWDYASGPGAPFDYQITLNGANPASPATVSLSSTVALTMMGLFCLVLSRKKRNKQ